VKGRFIQDNFRCVQAMSKMLHARKKLAVLMKIDLARAFDYVAWPFLLEVLQHLGCLDVWFNWVTVILSTASTRVLLNGNLGARICHTRGLRQGDPLSLMLFLLVMEILNTLVGRADERGFFE
jgi:hypothetical protein